MHDNIRKPSKVPSHTFACVKRKKSQKSEEEGHPTWIPHGQKDTRWVVIITAPSGVLNVAVLALIRVGLLCKHQGPSHMRYHVEI